MDYQIERPNVNLNGKFEESLQKGNTGIYFVLFVSAILFIASSIVIYSIFYLSVAARVQQIGQLQTIGMTEKQVKGGVVVKRFGNSHRAAARRYRFLSFNPRWMDVSKLLYGSFVRRRLRYPDGTDIREEACFHCVKIFTNRSVEECRHCWKGTAKRQA